MNIWAADHLFAPDASREVDRLALLRGAAERRHHLTVSESPIPGDDHRKADCFSAWVESLPNNLRNEIKLLNEKLRIIPAMAVTRGAPRLLVSNGTPDPSVPGCWLALKEAVRAVVLPLFILVENSINDAAFLRRALPPRWAEWLRKCEERGMVRFEHGGGRSIVDIVNHFSKDNCSLRGFGLPAKAWQALHFVLCDHDGTDQKFPGEVAVGALKACKNAAMLDRFHCLERKKQENYLPKEAARAIINITGDNTQNSPLEEFYKLPRPERDFIKPPACLKNRFEMEGVPWSSDWFRDDGVWPEMTRLAEKIAASM